MAFSRNQHGYITAGIGGLLLALLLVFVNATHGNLNQDEGWYLYAAKLVAVGKLPYRDFAFTQGPVFPFVYSWFYPVIEHWGIAGGRIITTFFGLGAAVIASLLAGRAAVRNKVAVAIATFLLVGCNVYQSYFTTAVKTYGLCSFLLISGIYLLVYRRRWWGCLLGGVVLALAAGCRLSAGIVLPIAGIWLVLQRREHRSGWLWFGLGGGLTLLAEYAPFFAQAFDQTRFCLLGYHVGREGGGVMLKAGFVSRFLSAYFLFVLLALGEGLHRLDQKKPIACKGIVPLLWGSAIAVSAVHFFAPFPYDDYQVIVYPLFGSALALSLSSLLEERRAPAVLLFLLLASGAAAFSSPINQDWFVRGRDRIWWQLKEQSDLSLLRDTAAYVREHTPEGSVLLTQDTYLAVEAGRDVPSGMEMGPFCYYPDMPRDQAEKMHLLNEEMLMEVLRESTAPMAAFSGYGLAIESPAIVEVDPATRAAFQSTLLRRFRPAGTVENFGQAHTALNLYRQSAR